MAMTMRVGILMGGFSSEREISLRSGTAVANALRHLEYGVECIDFLDKEELLVKLRRCEVDCVFNALHGRFGEDGEVQALLDGLHIPYTGSGAQASRLAMDKIASRRIFQTSGLLVPEYEVLDKHSLVNKGFFSDFPLVVKPSREGSSIGLSIVHDAISLLGAIERAARLDHDVIVEKYIKGREVTVGILNDCPLPVIEVVPKNEFYDFQAKYTAGMTEYIIPARLPEAVAAAAQLTAMKAHIVLGCRCFSRVDIIIVDGKSPVVLEVNTIPGLTATSLLPKAAAACGIDFPQLCREMVLSAVKERRNAAVAASLS